MIGILGEFPNFSIDGRVVATELPKEGGELMNEKKIRAGFQFGISAAKNSAGHCRTSLEVVNKVNKLDPLKKKLETAVAFN